jgi:phospholipid/cholesterol/gamma-HCH transport system substrate-binding protein
VDDVLNDPVRDPAVSNRLIAGRDLFVGLGVFFTDDDLKSILPFAPARLP